MIEWKSLELAANLASQSATLPAVATCTWCETTARALCIAQSRCAVVVRFVDQSGEAPGSPWPGFGVSSQPANQPLIDALRSAAGQGIGDLNADGVRGNHDPNVECKVMATTLDPHVQSNDPVLALMAFVGGRSALLGESVVDPERGVSLRIVIAESAASDEAPFSDADAEALRAVMRRITLRAKLAFVSTPGVVIDPLNCREAQVLESLTNGLTIRQIAADMHRSTHTIHDYLKSMHRKIGVGSRAELIARAAGRCDPRRDISESEGARQVA